WVSPEADAAQTKFVPAANTFWARAFDGTREVRWYIGHEPVTVAVPTGSGADGPGLAGPRLLWGEATDAQHLASCACGTLTGWSHLSDPRIGTIVVPVPLAKAQRAVLNVREVIATDSHGNRCVTDEVIVGLAAMTTEGGNRNV
ncbi:MAG: hypothetical protein QG597_4018, partial [Actinomycetota bacterium]|nr:hypothetical protein [Actinomycetota bacterium]